MASPDRLIGAQQARMLVADRLQLIGFIATSDRKTPVCSADVIFSWVGSIDLRNGWKFEAHQESPNSTPPFRTVHGDMPWPGNGLLVNEIEGNQQVVAVNLVL